MSNSLSPQFWSAPTWHPDFGDAQHELEHLRTLATAVLLRDPDLMVELRTPEPGLMFLVVARAGSSLAEAYSILESNKSTERRYGVFLFPGSPREQEEYADSLDKAVGRILSACENQTPGGTEVIHVV